MTVGRAGQQIGRTAGDPPGARNDRSAEIAKFPNAFSDSSEISPMEYPLQLATSAIACL
jgi:hypothetical protein